MLERAIQEENYEMASKLQEEIKYREKKKKINVVHIE